MEREGGEGRGRRTEGEERKGLEKLHLFSQLFLNVPVIVKKGGSLDQLLLRCCSTCTDVKYISCHFS